MSPSAIATTVAATTASVDIKGEICEPKTAIKRSTNETIMKAIEPTLAASKSHIATTTLAANNPQNLDLTARYVVRNATGSSQNKCATRLRVAPPMTIKLNSAPQMIITMPASKSRT